MKKAGKGTTHAINTNFAGLVPLTLAALLVAVLLVANWQQPSLTGRVVSTAACLDKDGDNPFVVGEVVVTFGKGTEQELVDKCVENKVLEYTCDGNRVSETLYDCPCNNGKCNVNFGWPAN